MDVLIKKLEIKLIMSQKTNSHVHHAIYGTKMNSDHYYQEEEYDFHKLKVYVQLVETFANLVAILLEENSALSDDIKLRSDSLFCENCT